MADTAQQIATLIAGMNLTDEQITLLTQNLATLKQNSLNELDDAVAKAKEGTRLTRAGFALMGKAIAGKQLHYTRVCLGDATLNGQMILPTEDEAYEYNNLINPRMNVPMSDVQFTGGGTVMVKCQVKNADVAEGFHIAEIGLFAVDPDTQEEVLYCYRNSGIASDYMPASGGAVVWDITLSIITVVDKATNITAVIDANLAYLSQAEFTQHVNSLNPHPNIPQVSDEVEVASTIWTSNSDNQLHPITIENLTRQVLGGDASDIPRMNSRLTQTEINVANLYLQLKAEADLGLHANLMLIEDFADNACCDLYECDVLTAVAGINNIQLESDKGILAGSWYTITDGAQSEYVQVRSVVKNGDAYVAILENQLTKTYDLSRTKFIRSNTLITDKSAQGAGDIRGIQLTFNNVWQGTGGNVASTLVLETSQKNAADFTIEGDGSFTTDGFFTLSA
ncbi:MAG: hypothetical protein IJ774_05610 [Selenomonadaceae bacterium]|nr:hypothetical protein [Selenomonadaceae bacterium]